MNINLLINGSLYSSQAAYTGLRYAQAAVAQGHVITQVFFHQDGALHGSALTAVMSDELDIVSEWSEFARQFDVPLFVCVSAAERRGVLGQSQAAELGKSSDNLHAQFSAAGLGVLHEASLTADRTVTFS